MAFAYRRVEHKSEILGRWFDDMIVELSANELREEIAEVEKTNTDECRVTLKKIDAETAKRYIFERGYTHTTGYWYDGEKIRYARV